MSGDGRQTVRAQMSPAARRAYLFISLCMALAGACSLATALFFDQTSSYWLAAFGLAYSLGAYMMSLGWGGLKRESPGRYWAVVLLYLAGCLSIAGFIYSI